MARYHLATTATRIPVPGDKRIDELFGRVSTESDEFSLAHMIAPPGWSEPDQTPTFSELTVMVRGRLEAEVDGDTMVLEAGHALWVEPGVRVSYRNPFDEESEYFAFCWPAFTIDRAHRDDPGKSPTGEEGA